MPKPLSYIPGYVCSLKARFGFVVVIDTEASPLSLDPNGTPRWRVSAFDKREAPIAHVYERSQREARATMKRARDGTHPWIPAPNAPTPATNGPGSRRSRTPDGFHACSAQVGEGEHTVTIEFRNGSPLPAQPDSRSYMRGWAQAGAGSRFTD